MSVRWESLGLNSARTIVSSDHFEQAVDISVGKNGQPHRVVIQRWSNENSRRVFRQQPFGGDLSEIQNFDGYWLPTRVEGGNHIGTSDYFPFFKAKVSAIRFPTTELRVAP